MKSNEIIERVPCRGCLADCVYYSECDGRLWRLEENRQKKLLEANDDFKSRLPKDDS